MSIVERRTTHIPIERRISGAKKESVPSCGYIGERPAGMKSFRSPTATAFGKSKSIANDPSSPITTDFPASATMRKIAAKRSIGAAARNDVRAVRPSRRSIRKKTTANGAAVTFERSAQRKRKMLPKYEARDPSSRYFRYIASEASVKNTLSTSFRAEAHIT